jgi:hypothetical protein
MPPLLVLALRYLAWFVGLSFLYGLLVNFTGLPRSLATSVILAAAPAADVGMQAVKRATRDLVLGDWATIWGMCMALYLLLGVVGPALLFPPLREALADPGTIRTTTLVVAGTAAMMALFLWIGKRSAGGRAKG